MQWTLHRRSAIGAPEIYLTVFDRSERSVSIHGTAFTEVESCTFQLGSQIDDDRIWRREL
jgi:hypothetical protein